VFLFVLVGGSASAATAYTIVFRDGHTIEAPSTFTLTNKTLSYEAAPGINRTLQLILVDVAATERANHEVPGGFFKHAEQNVVAAPAAATRHAQHTLTNIDLEPSRQRRLQSEQKYEQRRIELGLPSLEETRRRQALEEEETLNVARRRAATEANDEAYWRGRARALRNEIVTLDAEINYARARIGPLRQVPFVTGGFISSSGPAGPFGRAQRGAGQMGTTAPGRLTNLGAVALRPSRSSGGFGFPQSRLATPFPISPFGYADNSYDLNFRLNDLLQRRAGLDALWYELENEARIARVPQVWLAPY
jgi:hypothetical protein